MRHRVVPWWQQLASTSLGRRAYSKSTRSFIRRVDENGEVYYTVARKWEGKDMPKQPAVSNLFEMPDLVLDLDAEGADKVREFTSRDEERLNSEWGGISPKRTAVRAKMNQLAVMLGKSRNRALDTTFDSTHPARITDHDIMSVALRGYMPTAKQRGASVENEQEDRVQNEKVDSNRPVITSLTQSERKNDDSLSPSSGLPTQELVQTDTQAKGIRELIAQGDPRRKPDYMKRLRVDNGIPLHAGKDDESFIRWLTLRQHNLNYTKEKLEEAPPTPANIVKALGGQQEWRASLSNIRRIVFQCITAGTDLGVTKSGDSEEAANVPLGIRNACERILDTAPHNDPPHYEMLTFVNNLAERLPEMDGDMAACIFALRLRTLAGLGLSELTATHLDRGAAPEMWSSDMDTLRDVKAALKSWKVNLEDNLVLQTADARRLLFCNLTGFGESGATLTTSYRSLLLHPRNHKGEKPHSHRLMVYGQYIELLGRLGAVRTLWKEWTTVPQLEAQVKEEDPISVGEVMGYVTGWFQNALLTALTFTDVCGGSSTKDLSLKECAVMDLGSIGPLPPDAERGDDAGGSGSSLMQLSPQKFTEMMDLPLEQWLESIKRRL